MNALLWTLQIVLALVFACAGAIKLIQPRDRLAKTLDGWIYDFPGGAVVTHAHRGEFPNVVVSVVLAVMAAVVAWARFAPYCL